MEPYNLKFCNCAIMCTSLMIYLDQEGCPGSTYTHATIPWSPHRQLNSAGVRPSIHKKEILVDTHELFVETNLNKNNCCILSKRK